MVKSITLTLAVIALLSVAAFTQARPLERKGSNNNNPDDITQLNYKSFYNDGEGNANGQHGNVVVVVFSDSHYVASDYSYITIVLNALLSGKTVVKSYAFPANAAAVASAVANALSGVKVNKNGPFSITKTYLVAHGDAAAAVEAYAASTAAHASVAGLAFLGALPTAPLSSFAATSRSVAIVAGDLDGVSPVDTLAYRYLDESAAANSRLYVKLITGLTNAQFASGVRKYSSDVATSFASSLLAHRIKIVVFLTAWVNYDTHFSPASFAALYNKAILTSSTNEAAQAFSKWDQARAYDKHSLCVDFQLHTMNLLPTTTPPTIYNQLPDNYDQFVLSKSWIFPANFTISVSTYKWALNDPTFGLTACKGKAQAGVYREGIYAGQDQSTVWGPILSAREVHQKQYALAQSLASSDAVQRFANSGRSLTFAADETNWPNGPGFLASPGPFLFRSAADANTFVARSDSYRSPDVCRDPSMPQYCTNNFLSAYYAKLLGAQAFLKFLTYQSLQD